MLNLLSYATGRPVMQLDAGYASGCPVTLLNAGCLMGYPQCKTYEAQLPVVQ